MAKSAENSSSPSSSSSSNSGNSIAEKVFDGSQLENITKSLSNLQTSVSETSQKIAQDSVDFAKRYPIHTAVGAGVLGFAAGYAVKQIRK